MPMVKTVGRSIVLTFLDSRQDGGKVIVDEDDVCGLLSNICSALSH